MKLLKSQACLLLLATLFIFSACEEESQEPEVFTYSINTIAPEIGGESVTFKGRLNTADKGATYGFMWYEKHEAANNGTVNTIPVGSGALDGEFSFNLTLLPKGKVLVVCAYVEYTTGIELISEVGEELDFGWE